MEEELRLLFFFDPIVCCWRTIGMKKCKRCGDSKPESEFSKRSVASDGLNAKCKLCATEVQRAWCAQNKDKVKGYNANRTPRLDRDRERWHRYRKFAKHGLTPERHQEFVDSQEGTCFFSFCDSTELCVDHDHSCCPGTHSCGKCIRGLLCRIHNAAIGAFDDDPDQLREAADYIEAYRLQSSPILVDTSV